MADLLSITEAAQLMGITRISMWQWVQEGRVPATRLGRFWYIDPADLEHVGPRRPGRHCKERPRSAPARVEHALPVIGRVQSTRGAALAPTSAAEALSAALDDVSLLLPLLPASLTPELIEQIRHTISLLETAVADR